MKITELGGVIVFLILSILLRDYFRPEQDVKIKKTKRKVKSQGKQNITAESFFKKDFIIDSDEVEKMIKMQKLRDPKFNGFDQILVKNKLWAAQTLKNDPQYFSKHVKTQNPNILWIGCSDSRVSSSRVTGSNPGQVFVHRNVANMVPLSDVNAMAVVQYAVDVLKVKHIIVAGHYGCGGVRAALTNYDHGPLENWLSHLRQIRVKYSQILNNLEGQAKQRKLIELNVKEQVLNIGLMAIVQNAWNRKQNLTIHGVVYDLHTGILNDLNIEVGNQMDIPKDYRIFISDQL